MNKQRRADVSRIINKIEAIKTELEYVTCDEQEAYDNMPFGLQQSDRGMGMENALNLLYEAQDDLDNAVGNLNEAIE